MAFRFHFSSPVTSLLRKSFQWHFRDDQFLRPTTEIVEIAVAAGQYELLLKKIMRDVHNSTTGYTTSADQLENLLNYATPEQIEKIVIPEFLPMFDKKYSYSNAYLYQSLLVVFKRASPDCVEKMLPILFKFLAQEETPSLSEEILLVCIEKMTPQIIVKIIVPGLFQLCGQDKIDSLLVDSILSKLLLKCIEKLTPEAIETAIVPQLPRLYTHLNTKHFVDTLILKCIEKMDTDAVRRSLQLELETRFVNLESAVSSGQKNYAHQIRYRDIAFVPYLALIARFDRADNDKISERLLQHLSIDLRDSTADYALTFLKELRRKQIYVNETFFQALVKIVNDRNETYLNSLSYSRLLTSHMTASQVESFVEKRNTENPKINKSYLRLYEKLAALPMEIYPLSLRMKSLLFFQSHLDDASVMFNLTKFLTGDFSFNEFRKILFEFVNHALTNIDSICKNDQVTLAAFDDKIQRGAIEAAIKELKSDSTNEIGKYEYARLLGSCTSLMTEGEWVTQFFPKIRQILQSNSQRTQINFIGSIMGTLKEIFSQINNEDICREFFGYSVSLYLEHGECSDLLPVLSDKVDLITLSSAYRQVLHSDHSSYMNLDRHAYLLALFAKRIPQHANESKSSETNKITRAVQQSDAPCAMM